MTRVWKSGSLKMQMTWYSANRSSSPQRFPCNPKESRIEGNVMGFPFALPSWILWPGAVGQSSWLWLSHSAWIQYPTGAFRDPPSLCSAQPHERVWGRTCWIWGDSTSSGSWGCAPQQAGLHVQLGGENSRPHQALTRPLHIHTIHEFPRDAVINYHRLSGFEITDIYSLTVLEARSPLSRCWTQYPAGAFRDPPSLRSAQVHERVFETTDIYALTVLEARSQLSRYWQVWFHVGALREKPPHPLC